MKGKKILDILAIISILFVGFRLFSTFISRLIDLDLSKSPFYIIGYITGSVLPLIAIVYIFIWIVLKIKKEDNKKGG